ncbi:MAG: hypothetical protein EKK39_08085 [Sphingobacteriales bacterium]|uniref:hypothetical protein n=1 Tax=Hydrotalea flava TaxID=714549 RepID=UPI000835FFA3|nr:hypothetical protein [Hydrotalea flava]RTL51556.1 MAG: hypothetical protein EKK39_08085 [Sphingobacteriales bacterium]
MKKYFSYILVIALSAFGLLTLFLSTSVIFDLFGIRAKEGNYVLLVVWANFISSLLYLFAAYRFMKSKKWTIQPLMIAALILLIAFIGLWIHIKAGGIYETKTIVAIIFKILVTVVFTAIAYFKISNNNQYEK